MNREHSVIFEIAPKHWFWTLLLTMFSSVQFSHSVVSDSLWPHEPQHARPPCPSPTPGVHPNPCPLSWWCHPTISSCCPLLHLPSIFPSSRVFPIGSYAILFITTLDFTSITNHIHSWALFLLWLFLLILFRVIYPLFSSSILWTYWPGEFIFQCPIFLLFHTVHGILKERMLKWLAIPLFSWPHFVRTLHHELSILGGPTWHGLQFHWVRQGCDPCDQFD